MSNSNVRGGDGRTVYLTTRVNNTAPRGQTSNQRVGWVVLKTTATAVPSNENTVHAWRFESIAAEFAAAADFAAPGRHSEQP